MRLAQELINLPVMSIDGGQEIGKVKDLYLDDMLRHVTAISLGSEGFLSRTESLIRQADIVTVGQDTVLVRNADCVLDEVETPELGEWTKRWKRRDELQGQELNTPGGTKIGRLGDIILDEETKIVGFSLSQTFVSGPVANNRAISRSAMVETNDGEDQGSITIDLAEAERANLRVEFESFFSEPVVTSAEESEGAR